MSSDKHIKSTNPDFLDNRIIFLDGLIGGGKTLMSQIMSSIQNVEMWQFKSKYEHVCALHELGEINLNGAASLIKLWLDEEADDASTLRHANYRFQDQSSIFKYPRKSEYIKRLFESGGKESLDKFVRQKRVLNFMTHSNTAFSKPIFEALNERLIFIRFNRCPLSVYMVNHLSNWSERFGKDVRNGMLLSRSSKDSSEIPFFIQKRRELYSDSSPIDRAIFMLEEWQTRGDLFIDKEVKDYKSSIFDIPFEDFVFYPDKYLSQITSIMNADIDSKVRKEMKKQQVPRNSLTDAPYDKNYERMGWKPPTSHPSILVELKEAEKEIKKRASKEAFEILKNLTEDYFSRYKIT